MVKSKFFPFSFSDFYFDDATLHFEGVIFNSDLGPFEKGERCTHLHLDILDGQLVCDDENDTEKKAILKVGINMS